MDASVSASTAAVSASGRADTAHGAPDDPAWRWATLSPALLMMLLLSVLPLANLFLTSFYTVTWADFGMTVAGAGALADLVAVAAVPRAA